jgi:type I restriction enzyme S subunit
MENLPALNLKNLDKSHWKTYRFDEIAKNISERVDPNNTDLEVYVGLEHIDSESIHLKRSGTPDDVDGQKLRFYPGDIIFGRRRAYQRKAAIATTHGFCSAHALVLRANPGVIAPRLFPFFMHSDAFMHRAVDISVGSLSPTINWSTLKSQTFNLPSLNEQNELVNLFDSLSNFCEKQTSFLDVLNSFYENLVDELFSKKSEKWKYLRLGDVAHINKSSLKSNTDPNYEFKYLDIASIVEPKQIGSLEILSFSNAPSRARRVVQDGSIVISLVRPYLRSFVMIENAQHIIASTGTAVIDAKNGFYPSFIFHQFFSKKFLTFSETKMSGTNYPSITPSDLSEFEIAIPINLELQIKEANKLDSIDKQIRNIKENILITQTLLKQMINQIF